MATIGLFTRQDARKAAPKVAANVISPERLHELGERAVERMNPKAVTKHMQPSGSNRPDVYVLGEAPGEQEDEEGRPFMGPSGKWIRQRIPDDLEVRFNNVCRTLPVFRGKGGEGSRRPTQHEVEAYRPSVEADIEKTKPKVIIGCGGVPLYWAFGLKDSITSARGRRFPIRVGKHVCWYYPILHPAYVLRCEKKGNEQVKYGDGTQKVPGKEVAKVSDRDMDRVMRDARKLAPPELEDTDTLFDGVSIEHKDADRVIRFIRRLRKRESVVGLDLECNDLRPYEKKGKPPFRVLSCSLTGSKGTLAFPINHPETKWKDEERKQILNELLKLLLENEVKKVVHNLLYDLEILVWMYDNVELLNGNWGCSQRQAYVLDERKGCQSLNALTQMRFGFKIKEFTDVDRRRLVSEPLEDVLRYNGPDSKFHRRLYLRQQRLLRDEGRLLSVYEEHVQRVPSLVMMQRVGLPVSQVVVKDLQGTLETKASEVTDSILANRVIKKYENKYGRFNPNSPDQWVTVFRDILKRDEGKRSLGKYSTDEDVLNVLKKDEPLAGLLLELRRHNKLKGTYVDRMDIEHPESYVYSDGRLHAQFKDTQTDTSRLACADPNQQNWPKRKDAEIRRSLVAACAELEKQYGLGPLVLVSTDYGQIEYRTIGMISLDKVVVDSCWSEYDVHAEWAERILKVWDKTFKARYAHLNDPKKAFKAFRGDVKNQFVFPFFFKAGYRSIAGNLEMPEDKILPVYEDAKEIFNGVVKWQDRVVREYEQTGYVETLIGRRRHGPMSVNMVVNTGAQSLAADLNVNAMNRLRRKAIERDKLWLAPVIQIHDDLTFIVPKKKLDEAIPVIVRTMCDVPFKWAHSVPISCEVSIGTNMAEMKHYGNFRSDRLDEELKNRKAAA
jgi:uracil-DNA glycosylase family 4